MSIYIGVNGQAKKVSGVYIGNNQGQAIPIYTNDTIPSGYFPIHFIYRNGTANLDGVSIELTPTIYTRTIIVTSTGNDATSYNGTGYAATGYPLYGGSSYQCNFYRYWNSGSGVQTKYYRGSCGNGSFSLSYSTDSSINDTSHKYIVDINRNTSKQTYVKYESEDYQLKFTNTSSSITAEPLKIFKGNCNLMKIYYIEIYENIFVDDKPTIQLYPCIKQDGWIVGMYDIKSGNFYGHSDWSNGPSIETYPNYL